MDLAPEEEDFAVERIIGSGSYGVVLLVREVRQDGMAIPPKEQGRFALKLQNTEATAKQNKVVASREVLAQREHTIYEDIWGDTDDKGRQGHPNVIRLVASRYWPDGKEFFLEKTRKLVTLKLSESSEVHRFHYALLMEYCSMGTLGVFVTENMRRGLDNAAPAGSDRWATNVRRFTAELTLVLDFLHNEKLVIYRDLKPDNVLIDGSAADPHVKLGDFGFAKFLDSQDAPTSLAGGFYFASPEMMQILKTQERAEMTTSVDVYALGRLVWVMAYGCDLFKVGGKDAAGRPVLVKAEPKEWPGDGKSVRWMAPYVQKQPLHPKTSLVDQLAVEPQCPPGLTDIIMWAKNPQPEDRPTVAQLKELDVFGDISLASGQVLPPFSWEY